jgi:hypothetical protein
VRDRILAAAMLALGAATLATGWSGWLAAGILVAAALIPYAALLLAVRLRVPVPLALLGLLAGCGAGAYLVSSSTGTTLPDAIPRLLTAARPAPAVADLLLPGAAAAALVGLWVGLRVARSDVISPLAGAVVLYACGELLTAGRADRYGVTAAALVALAFTQWVLRSAGRRALWGVSVASALAIGTAALVPAAGGFEPRQLVHPPPVALSEPNPLPELAAWAQQGNLELLRHTGPGVRLRLAVLSDFDGAAWRTDGQFRPIGAVTAPDLPAGPDRSTVDVSVTVCCPTACAPDCGTRSRVRPTRRRTPTSPAPAYRSRRATSPYRACRTCSPSTRSASGSAPVPRSNRPFSSRTRCARAGAWTRRRRSAPPTPACPRSCSPGSAVPQPSRERRAAPRSSSPPRSR